MGPTEGNESFFQGMIGKVLRRKPPEKVEPQNTPMAMLDRLFAGEHPDYCLYVRPPAGGAVPQANLLSIDIEQLLAKGLDPLPMITLDEHPGPSGISPLPDQVFLTLANKARIVILVPMADHRFILRLRAIKSLGPIGRCIFVMPEQGTLGTVDWSTAWPAAAEATAKVGIELSTYTAGGWIFRVDKEGKAVTFRPIVNPNPEKVAKALEGVCGEME